MKACENNKHNMSFFDRRIIGSSHISFLFGAGVNGGALPQLDGFVQTKTKMDELGADYSKGFEAAIDTLAPDNREVVKNVFIKELKEYDSKVDFQNDSIKNLSLLFGKTAQIVNTAQNRNVDMNQINIFSLNYDSIAERVLKHRGAFFNSISASNVNERSHLLNTIGYDYVGKKYVPSFMISKLHGDFDRPIIPGRKKYEELLDENYFEIAFNMKEHLSRANSILIVIGYSGRDNHINMIIKDCINNGLMVYWYKYKEEEDPAGLFSGSQIQIRGQNDYSNPVDATLTCYEDLSILWEEKLDE